MKIIVITQGRWGKTKLGRFYNGPLAKVLKGVTASAVGRGEVKLCVSFYTVILCIH